MAFSKEQIEYLHNAGKMPDWAYYQQNGATAQENYNRWLLQRQNQTMELLDKMLGNQIEASLESILKDLSINNDIKIFL